MVTTLYKVSSKKKKRSKTKVEYFETFALALSRVSVLRNEQLEEIVLVEHLVENSKILVQYTIDNAIERDIRTLEIKDKIITTEVVDNAFKIKLKETHPDAGGNEDDCVQVIRAKNDLLKRIMSSGDIVND